MKGWSSERQPPFKCIYCLKYGNVRQRGTDFRQCLSSKKTGLTVKAAAVPMEPMSLDSVEQRKDIGESYGFTQIGKPVPESITLKDVIDSRPRKVFEIDDKKAWKSVFISVTSYALGIFMISKSPWYLLPLAWAWTGTAVTGFFVIGHDSAHKSFSKNKLVEDIVGTLAFLPLIYPYEQLHNSHWGKMCPAETPEGQMWPKLIDLAKHGGLLKKEMGETDENRRTNKTVFVTVGTTCFDALVREVDTQRVKEELSRQGYTDLLIQMGRGSYTPFKFSGVGSLAVDYFRFSPSISDYLRSASLVISHAGKKYDLDFKSPNRSGQNFKTGKDMIEMYTQLCTDYPIASIEEPFDKDDWEHTKLFSSLGICQVPSFLYMLSRIKTT